MGGILSSQTQTITVTEVPPVQTTVEESKPADSVAPTNTISETTSDPVNEVVSDKKNEETPVAVEDKPEEVLERYVEPVGKKVEVAPVEVATGTDVVKKTKKKNNNKNNKNKSNINADNAGS